MELVHVAANFPFSPTLHQFVTGDGSGMQWNIKPRTDILISLINDNAVVVSR